MAGYVPFDYPEDDPDELLFAQLERLAEREGGWTPHEAHLEYGVLAETTRQAHETRQVATNVAASIFATFGTALLGLPPRPGSPANGTAVFTLADTTGRTVPAGTEVLWPVSGEDPRLFVTAVDVTAAAGAVETPPVQVMAAEAGEDANGLAAGPLELVDALAFVSSVRATTGTAGGSDPETELDYLDRLAESLTLLRRVPVLARDFAVLARDVPGVHRALAVDGLNPTSGATGVERTVAVGAVDEAGQPVSAVVLQALEARLQAEREVNFDVRTMAPTYTTLAVTFTGRAAPGSDPAVVLAQAVEAVRSYLSPASWGGGDERPPAWRVEPVVGFLNLAGVVKSTPGLEHLDELLVNGGTADVPLQGYAPLPSAASTVTGTVSSAT